MKTRSIKLNALYNVINQSSVILLQLITMKYISSVLHSDYYGQFNFCNSILGYFLLFAQLGISSYVIREGAGIRDSKEELSKLINEVFTINFCSTAFSILLYLLLVHTWSRVASNQAILYILGIQLVLNFLNVEWVYNIFEDFKFIALRNLIIQFISVVLMLLFVKSEKDYLKYVIIFSLASSVGYCINYFYSKRIVLIKITLHPNVNKHIRQILLLFFNSLAVLIYVNSDITILGIMKSASEIGVYSISVKIYTVVKRIFQAVVVTCTPRLSNYYTNSNIDEYKLLLKKIHDVLITIVSPMLCGLILTAKNAILIVSGDEYISGVMPLRILCIALIFSSLANYYVSCVLLPCKNDKIILVSTLISSLVNVCLNIILIPAFSLNGAAITTLIAEFIVMLSAYKASGIYRQKQCIKIYLKSGAGCIGIFLTCVVINCFNLNLLFDTLLKIACSILVYICVEIALRNTVIVDMFKTFRTHLMHQ